MAKKQVMNQTVEQVQDEKTFNRNKWLFTTTGIGRDMLYTLVSTYFLQYVQFGVTLSVAQFATISLLIGILGRVWDGINDPMMGAIVDGSHLKMGKFKPWILIGAIIDALLTIVLFCIARVFDWGQEATGWIYVGIICFVYLLWEAAFTMNDIGYWSMIPSLSRTKERRDTLTSMTVFFAGIGTIIMTGLVTLFTPGNVVDAYAIYSVVACLVVIIGQSITAFGVKEAPRDDNEQKEEGISFKRMLKTIIGNKQLLWMSLAQLCSSAATGIILGLIYNLYYMEVGYNGDIFYFVVIYAICNTLLQLVYPALAKKFGRKKIQFVSFWVMAVGFVGMCLIGWWPEVLPMNIVTICIFAILIFGGNTLFYTAEVINMNNCVEYNEYITGSRNEAVVTTMRPLIVKFGDAIKYLLVTLTLVLSGLYATTQNVSSIESQTSMFNKKITIVEDATQRKEKALEYVQGYIAVSEAKAQNKSDEEIDSIVKNYQALVDCQFDHAYYEAVGQMYLIKFTDANNNDGYAKADDGEASYLALKDVDSTFIEDNKDYVLVVSIADADRADGDTASYNAADNIYSEHKNLGTRIIIRIFACLVPGLLMFACMMIQRKKFIIDEEYYDKIVKENAERKGVQTQSEQPVEAE